MEFSTRQLSSPVEAVPKVAWRVMYSMTPPPEKALRYRCRCWQLEGHVGMQKSGES